MGGARGQGEEGRVRAGSCGRIIMPEDGEEGGGGQERSSAQATFAFHHGAGDWSAWYWQRALIVPCRHTWPPTTHTHNAPHP